MNRWIRLHQSALHNPKLVTLSDRQYRAWNNCLLMADASDGKLPSIRNIACHLRMSVTDVELIISELVEVELIDMDITSGPRVFRMHDWKAHQYLSDSSLERTKKYRENLKKKDRDGDVTSLKRHRDGDVTPPESYSYSESDTESNGLLSSKPRASEVEDLKGLNKFFEMKDDRKKERLHRRAEGLGLDVEEIVTACNAHKAKNKPAYFTTLCVQRLQSKIKGLSEEAIRAALWDKSNDPYNAVIQAIMAAT
jgi:hypothetical protein